MKTAQGKFKTKKKKKILLGEKFKGCYSTRKRNSNQTAKWRFQAISYKAQRAKQDTFMLAIANLPL